MLVERQDDLAAVAEVVERGGLVLVEGPAGIGKTSLLKAAEVAAAAVGREVLRARGAILERDFAFGLAERLLGLAAPLAGAADAGLTATRAMAAEVAARSERTRLLLCVDDAQWADAESLRLLAYLARRLDGDEVALVVGIRSGESGAPEDLLDALRTEPAARALRPNPLGADAASAVLRAWAPDLPETALEACRDAAAGNPLYLRELARAHPVHADPVTAAAAGLGPAVCARIAAIGASATAVARAVAVLGDGAGLGDIAALCDVDDVLVGNTASALARIDVLTEGPAYGFVHPLLRSAVEHEVHDGTLLALHRAAADLLEARGASAQQIAAQVSACPPTGDPQAVRRLRAAAADALAQGAPASAAALLERALREPPTAVEQGDVALALGAAERRLGRRTAVEHLRTALGVARSPEDRASRALELAVALSHLGNYLTSGRTLQAALGEAPRGLPPALQARLRTNLVATATLDSRLHVDPALLDEAEGPEADLTRTLLGVHDTASADFLVEALAACPPSPEFVDLHSSAYFALIGFERHDAARELLGAQLDHGLERGWARGLWILLVSRARLEHTAGDLDAAAASLRALLDLPIEHYLGDVFGAAAMAAVLLDQGDVAGAARSLAAVPDLSRGSARPAWYILLVQARFAAELGDGEPAFVRFDHVRRAARASPGVIGVLVDDGSAGLVDLLLRDGRPDEAVMILEQSLVEAQRTGVAGLEGIVRRGLGLTRGEVAELAASVALLETSPRRLELARSLLELGAAQRRAGARGLAREPLLRSLDIATRFGAVPLASRARQELHAAGGRPRRDALTGPGALTASERRVADLAAAGYSNREVANRLFVSRKTVEGHLARCYAKLSIATRADLAGALTPDDADRPGRPGRPSAAAG